MLRVQKPTAAEVDTLRDGQTVIGLLQPLIDPQTDEQAGEQGSRPSASMRCRAHCRAPRPWTRCRRRRTSVATRPCSSPPRQYGRYFPLLTTAAGTAKPANVLILGIGVAGLQAIATARRLGALVKAYDVRSETREQAESLGAQFLELKSVADASGTGGYARELTAEERAAQQQELNGYIGGMDVVITTAQVPGRRPPLLVTAEAVEGMKPGSVHRGHGRAARWAATSSCPSPTRPSSRDNGVTIIAPTNLPATMPAGASPFYARNISALLLHFIKDGAMASTWPMRSQAATVITRDGEVVQAATAKLLAAGRHGGAE